MHILSPETDNCPSWISGRKRMTVENISWSISTKECCRPRRGLNPRPPGLQSDGASNWATEAGNRIFEYTPSKNKQAVCYFQIHVVFGILVLKHKLLELIRIVLFYFGVRYNTMFSFFSYLKFNRVYLILKIDIKFSTNFIFILARNLVGSEKSCMTGKRNQKCVR